MKLAISKTSKEIYSVVLKDLSTYGGFPFYGVVILAALLAGDLSFAYYLVVSLITVTVVVAALRLIYFKPRPGVEKKKYETLYERIDNSSFPSIHVARAVMLTGAFYSKAPVLLPLLLLMILIVLLSRLHFKRHDWVDIAVGIIIGLVLDALFF